MSVIGEGPGEQEVENGVNFIGWSGDVLNEALILGGINRFEQTVVNTIACRHTDNAEESLGDWIKKQERKAKREGREWVSPIDACRNRLARDLDDARSEVVLAIGKFALSAAEDYLRSRGNFEGDELVMSKVHGAPIVLTGSGPKYLFASYHPTFALHDPKWHKYVRANIIRAAKVAVRGYIDWTEPEYVIFPPLQYAIDWLKYAATYQPPLTVDLETCDPKTGKPSADPYIADLRCVGTGFTVKTNTLDHPLTSVMVYPFRHMDGTFWTYDDADRDLAYRIACEWWGASTVDKLILEAPSELYSFPMNARDSLVRLVVFHYYRQAFDACPVNGHNIVTFDSPIMLRLGLMSDRMKVPTDTLLLHHNTPAQDHQHSLSFVGREFTEAPTWKTKEDIASTDNADDGVLALRCARDVYVTNYVLPILEQIVEVSGTGPQNRTDHVVGIRERNACDLGLCVDERARGFWSRILTSESERLKAKWFELVGKNVNPRSPDQLKSLLYGDWKLEPALSVDGDVWDPDIEREDGDIIEPDEGSTGVQAIIGLTVLHERGIQPLSDRMQAAFDALLEFKAVDKPLNTYIHMDTREWPRDGYGWQLVDQILSAEGGLDRRPSISWIRPIASMGRTPVGRAAWKKPAEQQRPKQGRKILIPAGTLMPDGTYSTEPQKITANMRTIIRPAPGHKLVGADYKQSHIRIYAANSGDGRFYDIVVGGLRDQHGKEIDPHAYNSATLMAMTDAEMWEWYDKIQYGDKDFREYWRFVAKKYCIAEGELVLTHLGLVPIEQVTRDHLVWDGVEWVKHDGVVCQGEKEVITYNGLTATPDHKVWLTNGEKVEFEYAASNSLPLATTGRGNQTREVDSRFDTFHGESSQESKSSMPVRYGKDRSPGQPNVRQIESMSFVWGSNLQVSEMVERQNVSRQRSVPESEQRSMERLRRSRDSIRVRIHTKRMCLDDIALRYARSVYADRPDRQYSSLRAGESSLGYPSTERGQSSMRQLTSYGHASGLEVHPIRMAVHSARGEQETSVRDDEVRNHRIGERGCSESKVSLASGSRKVRVYDIMNAGPRRRFTVSNVLVSNCFGKIYGAIAETLYKTMKVERRRDNGKRAFPNLSLTKDCIPWSDNWDRAHPWTAPWQEREIERYRARGFAMSEGLDNRKRFGPLEDNQIPNHSILAEEGSVKNRAIMILEDLIPHRGWSDWTGLVYDGHDSLVYQVPEGREQYTIEAIEYAMAYDKNGMPYRGEAKVIETLGHL